jgi:hypothetical protein
MAEQDSGVAPQQNHDPLTCPECANEGCDELTAQNVGRIIALDVIETSRRVEGCRGFADSGHGVRTVEWTFRDDFCEEVGHGEVVVNGVWAATHCGDDLISVRNYSRFMDLISDEIYATGIWCRWDFKRKYGGIWLAKRLIKNAVERANREAERIRAARGIDAEEAIGDG